MTDVLQNDTIRRLMHGNLYHGSAISLRLQRQPQVEANSEVNSACASVHHFLFNNTGRDELLISGWKCPQANVRSKITSLFSV